MDYHSSIIFNYIFLALNSAASVILIISLLALCLLSFLFAGSEVAFFSLTNADINKLKTRENPAYQRIVNLLDKPKELLAGMLIANSLVNIGIILISNILVEGALEPYNINFWLAFCLKVAVVTSLLVLFCEVLPKIWATHQKILFAANASLIIQAFATLFNRFSVSMVAMSDIVEKKFTPSSNNIDNSHLDDAIDLLPEEEATIEEKRILKGIRKFSDTTVKQVMKTRLDVSGVDYDTNFGELVKQLEHLHYSRVPVYKSTLDEIVGLLHSKDLLPFINEPENHNWHPLIRTPYFVHEQKLIEDLLQEFRNKHIHFALVVDEFGGTSGIVTLEDIIEEITGDIKDEFDEEEAAHNKIDENNYVFAGKTMINDITKVMKLPADVFDEIRGDSDSLAGLVLEIAGAFPEINEQVVAGDFVFVPLEINKNRIEKIKVTLNRS